MEMTVARSEMHDRINRVIQATVPNLDGVSLCDLVDAILLTMREPTKAMIRDGESAASFGIGKPTDDEALPRVWQAMIDTALSPSARDPR